MPITNEFQTIYDYFPAHRIHVDYLVNWSDKFKLIYVETPKVGCTTIKKILQYNELDGDESRLPLDVHDRQQSPLKSPNMDEAEFLRCLLSPEYFKFTFVRNPITRVLSAYLNKIVGKAGAINQTQKELGINPFEHIPTFPEFVEIIYNQKPFDMNVHWAPQVFLLGINDVRYDYLGRFEHFEQSINHLASKKRLIIPSNAMTLGRVHATNADEILHKHYTDSALRRVQEIYYEDFRYLGYGWSL